MHTYTRVFHSICVYVYERCESVYLCVYVCIFDSYSQGLTSNDIQLQPLVQYVYDSIAIDA